MFVMQHVGCPVGTGMAACDRCDINCDGAVTPQDVQIVQCVMMGGDPSICCERPMVSPVNPWGWKTRQPAWSDAAVRMFAPSGPFVEPPFTSHWEGYGEPIVTQEGRWDMSFVLTTMAAVPCDGQEDCTDPCERCENGVCTDWAGIYGDVNNTGFGTPDVNDLLCMLDVIGGSLGATCNVGTYEAAVLNCDLIGLVGGQPACGASGGMPTVDDLLALLNTIGGCPPCADCPSGGLLCGNGVIDHGCEECDPPMDAACPGQCLSSCLCP
jgi:hypothetical protein